MITALSPASKREGRGMGAKLTAVQRDVLAIFGMGETAMTMRPQGGSSWRSQRKGIVRSPTLFALERAGLIEGDWSDWRWIKWTLTDEGRTALSPASKDNADA